MSRLVMKTLLISLCLSGPVLGGGYSYQGTPNTKFTLSADYTRYADSVAGCCFHCNHLSSEPLSYTGGWGSSIVCRL